MTPRIIISFSKCKSNFFQVRCAWLPPLLTAFRHMKKILCVASYTYKLLLHIDDDLVCYPLHLLILVFSVRHLSRHQFIYCILPAFSTYFLPTFSLQLLDMTFIQTSISFFIIFYLHFLPILYLLLHSRCSLSTSISFFIIFYLHFLPIFYLLLHFRCSFWI